MREIKFRAWDKNDQMMYVWGEHPEKEKIAKALKKSLDATEW